MDKVISKKERQASLEAADKFVKAGKYLEAIREYEKVQEEDNLDVNLTNLIGDLYLRLGKGEKAIQTFQSIANHYEAKGQYSQSLAIYKKITKINPNDIPAAIKMADLYGQLGFSSEAKAGYLKVAERLEKDHHTKGLIFIYEKLSKLDRTDFRSKVRLADLYAKEGAAEEAVEMLNEAAESLLESPDPSEAERLLSRANTLKKGHLRTAQNYIELMKKRNRRAEAVVLAEESLRHHPDNLNLLSQLGGLYMEEELYRKAEEIFSRLYAKDPNDINARVRLGYTLINLRKLDQAYDLYEPLVNTLLSKNREDKAVGLLGILVMGREVYLPALEKLAVIYKSKNQRENLETALRVLLQEYKKKGLRQKIMVVLRELVELRPDDSALADEFAHVGSEVRPPLEEVRPEPGTAQTSRQDKEVIRVNLAKADLCLQQGLGRNAKRILENLLLLYPHEQAVVRKLEALKKVQAQLAQENIPDLVEKVAALERRPEKTRRPAAKPEEDKIGAELSAKEKVTSAELFGGLDILSGPLAFDEKLYPDVAERIVEELAMIEAITFQQQKKDTAVVEKELADIIRDFRRDVDKKIGPSNQDVRYSLGMAFYDQGLFEEAVEEFKLAAADERRKADCFSLISLCFRRRKDYVRALDWLNQALALVKEGSSQSFVLKYELAALFEEMEQKDKALGLFSEVKGWNSRFRDVTRRIKTLKMSAG
ncbi:MAG TPA: tetratricopeptide repeat protein [Acidobacteriota bacterium]